MEGEGVSALKRVRHTRRTLLPFIRVAAYVFLFSAISVCAYSQDTSIHIIRGHWPIEPAFWREDPSRFLDPNSFTTTKELSDRTLWLQVGFGRPIAQFGQTSLGLEAKAWSRLRVLSDFRFPVETVDYFFGAFFVWSEIDRAPTHPDDVYDVNWRARLGHISSHDVDGKDSLVSGSSSKYSREFLELMRQSPARIGEHFAWAVGLRGYFHQVTKIEPWIAFPADIVLYITPFKRTGTQFSLFASSGAGPVWPNIEGGIRMERHGNYVGTTDLQLAYYYGASWAGTDAGQKLSQVKLSIDVRGQ